ncbi:MAG: hypothetical protein U0744_02760 [Gemmataceae bacterium]
MNEALPKAVLLVHVASTLFMSGLIWFVQIVHYPLFAATGTAEFPSYEERHARLTTWVVGPPMLLESATAILLLWHRPPGISNSILVAGLALGEKIWISTAFLQVPCHNRLTHGFQTETHVRLVATNWIRTAAWTLRAFLVLAMLWQSMANETDPYSLQAPSADYDVSADSTDRDPGNSDPAHLPRSYRSDRPSRRS